MVLYTFFWSVVKKLEGSAVRSWMCLPGGPGGLDDEEEKGCCAGDDW